MKSQSVICVGIAATALLLLNACTLIAPVPEVDKIAKSPQQEAGAGSRESGGSGGMSGAGGAGGDGGDGGDGALEKLSGQRTTGQICGADGGQCAPGLTCAKDGFCTETCDADGDCPPESLGSCGPPDANDVRLCTKTCDPVHPQSALGSRRACRPGYSCDRVGDGEQRDCVRHRGSNQIATACVSLDDCGPGLTCVLGACAKLCDSAEDCPLANKSTSCEPFEEAGMRGARVNVCLAGCDPAAPGRPRAPLRACGEGLTCSVFGTSTDAEVGTYCESAGTGTPGSTCMQNASCPAGQFCEGGHCMQHCAGLTDCGGTTCTIHQTVSPTNVQFGACIDCDLVHPEQGDMLHACPAGSGCHPASSPQPRNGCERISKPGELNELCTFNQECRAGLHCYKGLCKAYCETLADCKPDDSMIVSCREDAEQSMQPSRCLTTCEPVISAIGRTSLASCPDGLRCEVSTVASMTECARATGGEKAEGSGCIRTQECASGLNCQDRQCRRFCYEDADCPSDSTCIQQDPPAHGIWHSPPLGTCSATP